MRQIFLLLAISVPLHLLAQEKFFFEKISDNNLPFDLKVYSLLIDKHGFLWIGSDFGLHRYDGVVIKDYNQVLIPAATSRAPVTTLYQDNDGSIFVGTAGTGLIRLNPEDNTVKKIEQSGRQNSGNRIIKCIKSQGSDVFVGTHNGLFRYERDSDGLALFVSQSPDDMAKGKGQINNIEFDKKGNLWVGSSGGLWHYDVGKQQYKSYDSLLLKNNTAIWSLHFSNDTLWLATSGGLLQYNTITQQKRLHYFRHDNLNPAHFNATLSICDDKKGSMWITTYGGGAIRFHKRTGSYSIHRYDGTTPYTLSSNYVFTALIDDENTVWLGTERGVNKFVPSKQVFSSHLPAELFKDNPHDQLTMIKPGKSGTIWLLTKQGHIYRADESFQNINYIVSGHNRGGVRLESLFEDSNGTLWIGTSQGLARFDNKTSSITDELILNSTVDKIVEDRNRDLWLGTGINSGLIRYSPSKKRHKYISNSDSVQSLNLAGSELLKDSRGNIWISGMYALYKYELSKNNLTKIRHREELSAALAIDAADNLWMANYYGSIYKFDSTGAKIDSLQLKAAYDSPTNLLIDHNNQLWLSTQSSIVRIDPVTRKQQLFSSEIGFGLRDFLYNSSVKSVSSNKLFFAAEAGVITIEPENLILDTKASPLRITNFETHDSVRLLLEKAIEYTNEIKLDYDRASFTIEFAMLDLVAPDEVEYSYKLDGLTDEWYKSATQHAVNYTNLEPGSYSFTVKAYNHNGVLSESAPLRIIILPPPWRTWWAYSAYSLGALLLLVIGRKEIIKREKLKATARLKEVEAEKFQELDIMKSRFFANISHEFRTPLTLLLGPIEKRLSTTSDPSDKKQLATMHKNANRLLTLVNQLLDLCRLESGSLKLKCQWGNLNNAIDFISSQFSSMADSRNIKFSIDSSQDIDLYFDFEKLEKIITNLLSNAFKFTQENGSITVSIRAHGRNKDFKNGFAAVVVKDSGIGISPADLLRIFDRFYQVDSSATRQYEGSGIGLALVKELVELHHGTVSVASTSGEGTSFAVHLPLGKDHLSEKEISTQSNEFKSTLHIPEIEEVIGVEMQKHDTVLPKVLVVEDNADLHHYLRSCLSDRYSIMESKDGEEGFSKAVEEVPDLIISDLMMPVMDGILLTKKLKHEEKTSHIPIILLTAKADSLTKLEGLKTGADDYITKPFSQDELVTRVHNLIAIRKNLQKKYSNQLQLMPSQIEVDSMEDRFLKKVITIIEQHLDDTSFSVEVLSQEAAMSNTQLYRKLKSVTGFTPNEVIRNTRLERAASLLRQKAGNVADIAYQVGFNNLSYFSKCFKEKFGSSPSEFLLQKTDSQS